MITTLNLSHIAAVVGKSEYDIICQYVTILKMALHNYVIIKGHWPLTVFLKISHRHVANEESYLSYCKVTDTTIQWQGENV